MNNTTHTEASAVKVTRKVKKSEIRKMIIDREKALAGLASNSIDAGSCWESQKLGFSEGYIHALRVMLGEDEPNWDFLGK